MATIKAIESRSVHQIQSGQVIVDLNSVVKELVENSLDAGATSIEVRFKNQGLDSIEVSDNGKGIAPDDYATVALKHHTSKLSSYEDLTQLETFGFRGEALSSLCALSNFHVVTARAEDGAVGKKLDFDISGRLKGTTVQATPKGTTVVVEKLFFNLPVRRKELEKNIKREYGKVLNLLNAYACIGVGVRFSVSNQMPKGKKTVVFSTKLNTTTKENIANVFGAKTFVALLELELRLKMQPSLGPSTQSARNWATQATDTSKDVRIQGHISKPVFGEGRQAPDRQLFFVNSRPCSLPQVAKVFNEVYKSFNVSQNAFIFANLIMDTNAYDVNVSPDKRQIMLHDQAALLESLREALLELFEKADQTVPQAALPNRRLPGYKPPSMSRSSTRGSVSRGESEGQADGSDDEADSEQNGAGLDDGVFHRPRVPSANLITGWAQRNATSRDTDLRQLDHMKDASRENAKTGKVDVSSNRASEANGGRESEEVSHETRSKFPEQAGVQDSASLINGETSVDGSKEPGAESGLSSFQQHATPQSEPSIPAIDPPSQKTMPGPVQSAFDRMRPKRTPLQTAEITIGNTTTTTIIGDGPSSHKKRRIYEPKNPGSISKFTSSPLLSGRLRRFAAPDANMEIDEDDSDGDKESPQRNQDSAALSEPGQADESASQESSPGHEQYVNDGEEEDHSPHASSPDPIDEYMPASEDGDQDEDGDFVDESEKKAKEDEKVAKMIQEAELAASRPTEANERRALRLMKTGASRKDSTLHLAGTIRTSIDDIRRRATTLQGCARDEDDGSADSMDKESTRVAHNIEDTNAEARLSLTVSKSDFQKMRIIGQFNLGFILAVRPAATADRKNGGEGDELFIIDQHAADEKFNYERLQRTVTLQSQRLVHPKRLDLTAVEEEIILNHPAALKANGFEISTISPNDEDPEQHDAGDETERTDGEEADGHQSASFSRRKQFHLLTLPISGTKTLDLSDLEELLHLLSETPSTDLSHGPSPPNSCSPSHSHEDAPTVPPATASTTTTTVPRPRKIQRMLAMRACRSSIMVGRTLTAKQMVGVVRQMGEMEKPWNCPHGRPTMRHLAGLGAWKGWEEGEGGDLGDDGYGGVDEVGEVDDEDEEEEGDNAQLDDSDGVQTGAVTDWGAWLMKSRGLDD